MKLGLYIDMRKAPQDPTSWSTHYGRWLERFQEADRLGCSYVWLTEHHFFDDGYLPQIWTLASAIAARTKQIRIGSAVNLLPLHLPAELAEQIAMVDIISGGRVEAGFGVGYRKPEYEAFGGDFKHRYGVFRQRIHEMRALWGEEAGAPRTITPPPVQQPLPLWGGFFGPQGARMAGELGLGLQAIDPALLEPYLEGLEAAGHGRDKARMAGGIEVFVTDDPEKTWAEIGDFVTYRWASYNRYRYEGTSKEANPPERFEIATVRDRILIGTPDDLARQIRQKVKGLPVTHLYTWADFPGLSDEAIDKHIRLLVTELAPRLEASAS